MRVTKIIREYVEKTINSKITYGEPLTTYETQKQALSDLCSQLEEKVENYAQELLASIGNLPEGFTITRSNRCVFYSSTHQSPLYDAALQHQKEIREKRAKAIETILVELELGGTKADLERLIAEAIGE